MQQFLFRLISYSLTVKCGGSTAVVLLVFLGNFRADTFLCDINTETYSQPNNIVSYVTRSESQKHFGIILDFKLNFEEHLTVSHPQDIGFDLNRFNQYLVTLMVVLKQFQKNLFCMLRSLARISWDSGVPLGGKGFFHFITNFLIEVANQAKH